jgi:hypothetical protein
MDHGIHLHVNGIINNNRECIQKILPPCLAMILTVADMGICGMDQFYFGSIMFPALLRLRIGVRMAGRHLVTMIYWEMGD